MLLDHARFTLGTRGVGRAHRRRSCRCRGIRWQATRTASVLNPGGGVVVVTWAALPAWAAQTPSSSPPCELLLVDSGLLSADAGGGRGLICSSCCSCRLVSCSHCYHLLGPVTGPCSPGAACCRPCQYVCHCPPPGPVSYCQNNSRSPPLMLFSALPSLSYTHHTPPIFPHSLLLLQPIDSEDPPPQAAATRQRVGIRSGGERRLGVCVRGRRQRWRDGAASACPACYYPHAYRCICHSRQHQA